MNEELPQTEAIDPQNAWLDTLPSAELVALLVEQQRASVDAVAAQCDALAQIADDIAARLRCGGSLHYVGAGTSGRLGVLDAAEIPPTFGAPVNLVCAHIAGGDAALRGAVEGAEDDLHAGAEAMRDHVRNGDAVIGISASGGAPYVAGALEAARSFGAFTIAFVNTEPSLLAAIAEQTIVLRTGPEALAGSTRLKAGTSQKIALNALSTAVMVRLGKVYENLMVDVVASNHKLRARALRLVQRIAGVDRSRAAQLLGASEGRVKTAIVMSRRGVDADEAERILKTCGGDLRGVI